MVYGPCGGVAPDGGCEVPGLRCTFVDLPLPRWPGGPDGPAARQPGAPPTLRVALGVPAGRPVVVADLPAAPLDLASLRSTARRLSGHDDAVLLGDHGGARVQLPPSLRAEVVVSQGVDAWAGLNCRDRNRVALEGELAGLAAVGAAGVHCVTGDHTSLGHRADAQPVFDLDATRLVPLARAAGLTASVAENPVAPPVATRAERLAEKAAAGAQVCFVNHTSGPAAVAAFVAAARTACAARGAPVPEVVACVAVVLDPASAAVLRSFTGLELPPGYLEGVLAARDVRAAGVAAATRLALDLLAVDGVAGVDLSGGAGPGQEDDVAAAMAQVADAVREGFGP
jgi:5,10-methylenetetrahydrofolate reductase